MIYKIPDNLPEYRYINKYRFKHRPMKNFISVIIALSSFLIGCKDQKAKSVARIELSYETVYDSIYTRLPGNIFKFDHHAIWIDPFTSDNFLHIIDTKTKQETKLGSIGQGPMEFTTPKVSRTGDGNLFIYDLNSARQGIVSMVDKSFDLRMLKPSKAKIINNKLMITPEKIVALQPDEDIPLALEINEDVLRFGKRPLSLPSTITNGYSCFQGVLLYSPDRQLLIYSTIDFPSFSFYKLRKDGLFELEKEVIGDFDFDVVNDKLVFSEDTPKGPVNTTATKDYIVRIERDTKYDKTTAMGRDLTKLPQTLFLYSYEGELQKIVNMKTPLLRVGGDFSDNMIYAINADPEFNLIRINLDDL